MFTKNIAAKLALAAILGSSLLFPFAALANTWTTPNLWGTPPGFWGPLVSCTGNYLTQNSDGSTPNPCTSLCDLIDTAINIIYFGMSIALFIIGPVVVAAGAIMIMLSGSSPEMLTKGKKAIVGTVVGILLVLCAYLLVNTVLTVLNISGVGGFGNNSCTTTS